jgi:predicted amidohydrolase
VSADAPGGPGVPAAEVTVVCCQVAPVVGELERNRATARQAVQDAARSGADVVVLPELMSSGYVFADFAELQGCAETVDGPTLREWQELARDLDLVLVGGFAEDGRDGHVYNSAALVDPTGVRAVYRKTHLWDTEKAELFTAGSAAPPVVDTAVGRIGVMICYDVEFPEWVRGVALRGADLVCAPVNWPLFARPEGERPGEIVRVQAGASVNRMAIACADRVGTERGVEWVGGSVVVDQNGFPVSEIRLAETALITARVDLRESRVKAISERNDVHLDLRTDLYSQLHA